MAHTLSFANGMTATVDGVQVANGYALTKDCTIVISSGEGYAWETEGPTTNYGYYKAIVNGTTYDSNTSIEITDNDIDATRDFFYGGEDTSTDPIVVTINYKAASTPRLSVDVSTLAGWANLSAGAHSI